MCTSAWKAIQHTLSLYRGRLRPRTVEQLTQNHIGSWWQILYSDQSPLQCWKCYFSFLLLPFPFFKRYTFYRAGTALSTFQSLHLLTLYDRGRYCNHPHFAKKKLRLRVGKCLPQCHSEWQCWHPGLGVFASQSCRGPSASLSFTGWWNSLIGGGC